MADFQQSLATYLVNQVRKRERGSGCEVWVYFVGSLLINSLFDLSFFTPSHPSRPISPISPQVDKGALIVFDNLDQRGAAPGAETGARIGSSGVATGTGTRAGAGTGTAAGTGTGAGVEARAVKTSWEVFQSVVLDCAAVRSALLHQRHTVAVAVTTPDTDMTPTSTVPGAGTTTGTGAGGSTVTAAAAAASAATATAAAAVAAVFPPSLPITPLYLGSLTPPAAHTLALSLCPEDPAAPIRRPFERVPTRPAR